MRISFIGGGNMATALIGGMLDAGFRPEDIDVLEPEAAKGAELAHRFGCAAHVQPGEWLAAAVVIVLAVKPQQFHEAAQSIKPFIAKPLVVSIAAGVRAASIARWLGTEHVVRAMPNTPALIRAGISGVVALPAVTEPQRAAAARILQAVGEIVWLDTALLDPVTAISGRALPTSSISSRHCRGRPGNWDLMRHRRERLQSRPSPARPGLRQKPTSRSKCCVSA
jgi:pyrroline-5-carboxylate reductase